MPDRTRLAHLRERGNVTAAVAATLVVSRIELALVLVKLLKVLSLSSVVSPMCVLSLDIHLVIKVDFY